MLSWKKRCTSCTLSVKQKGNKQSDSCCYQWESWLVWFFRNIGRFHLFVGIKSKYCIWELHFPHISSEFIEVLLTKFLRFAFIHSAMFVRAIFSFILLSNFFLICHAGVFGFVTGMIACKAGCAAGYAACLAGGCGAASKFPEARCSKVWYELFVPF